jgi:hypothetical protein
MKANIVSFESLDESMFYIRALQDPANGSLHVFQKKGLSSGEIFGSCRARKFRPSENVIIITETSYAKLVVGSEFILAASALSPGGFLVPADILIKQEEGAYQVDTSCSSPDETIHIDGEERVFDLRHAFTFKNVTIAYLKT